MDTTSVVGFLGTAPELRKTSTGQDICLFRLGSNNRYVNSRGEAIDDTTWYNVAVFGSVAIAVHEHKQKGDWVAVHGRMVSSTYKSNKLIDNQSGQPATMTRWSLNAQRVEFGPRVSELTNIEEEENSDNELAKALEESELPY